MFTLCNIFDNVNKEPALSGKKILEHVPTIEIIFSRTTNLQIFDTRLPHYIWNHGLRFVSSTNNYLECALSYI